MRFPNTGIKVKPEALDDTTLVSIGRIVRAFAEIDHIVSMFIGQMVSVGEGYMVLLLGRNAISKKMEIAEHLARMAGGRPEKFFDEFFGKGLNDMLRVRNSVAHGLFLGRTEEGWAFKTPAVDSPVPGAMMATTYVYTSEMLKGCADAAEGNIASMESVLNLEASRRKRHEQHLAPHRKAQAPRKPSAKRTPPPRS